MLSEQLKVIQAANWPQSAPTAQRDTVDALFRRENLADKGLVNPKRPTPRAGLAEEALQLCDAPGSLKRKQDAKRFLSSLHTGIPAMDPLED